MCPNVLKITRIRPANESLISTRQLYFISETGLLNSDLPSMLSSADIDKDSTYPSKMRRALIAGIQRAGRGRHMRICEREPGNGLLCPMALIFQKTIKNLNSLSLVSACVLLKSLRNLLVMELSRIALKWTNDTLIYSRKLAGILIEIAKKRYGLFAIVIGLGLNLRTKISCDIKLLFNKYLLRLSLEELIEFTPNFYG